MTNGVLSDDMIMDGQVYPDLRSFHTSELNAQMDSHSTTTHSRTTFYAQWALKNSGFYTGPVNGLPGAGGATALYDAFVALYASQYSGGGLPAPSGGHVAFTYYKDVIFEQSSVDNTLYKVLD